MNTALAKPELRGRLEKLGVTVVPESTPPSVDDFLRVEADRWQGLLREAGVKAD